MNNIRALICAAGAMFSASCSTLPQTAKVDDLGTAIADSASLLKAAAKSNKNIAVKIGEERQAGNYISGAPFILRDDPDPSLGSATLKPRLEALVALEEYGKALKLAADQGIVDKLEDASVRLASAAGTLAAAASPATAPIASPALKFVGRGFGVLLGNMYAAEIHGIIMERDADVQKIVVLLKGDFSIISRSLARQAEVFTSERHQNLKQIRSDGNIDQLRLYSEYKAARLEVASQEALAVAARDYAKILDALAEAHEALAKSDPDSDQALKHFVALTNDLVDLVSAVSKEQQQ